VRPARIELASSRWLRAALPLSYGCIEARQ
jgi:hypothetical protein